MKYITPATKSIENNKDNPIAIFLLIFFRWRKFTRGFNKIAIIKAKAKGTNILLKTNRTYTKSIIPNKVTVDLKKKGYFFCIKN